MIKANTILKDTYFYTLAKLFPGISGFFFLIIFTRIIGIEEYGQYSLLISKFTLIVSFGFGWLNQSELRYPIGRYKSYNTSRMSLLACSAIIILPLIAFSIELENAFYLEFSKYFICIISIGIFTYVKTVFQSKILPKKVLNLSILQALFNLLIPLCAFLLITLDSNILLICSALSSLFSSIILIAIYNTKISNIFNTSFNKNDVFLKLKYGFPISIWSSVGLLLPYLDRFYINKFLTADQLGIYSSFNELIIRSFSFLIFPFTMALHPRIINLWNKGKKEESIRLITLAMKIILIFLIIIVLFMSVFKIEFFKIVILILPNLDKNSISLLIPLVSTGILWQLSFFTHKMIELKEKTFLMIIFILFSLVVNLIGNIYYLPYYGIIATAYTSLFSALTYCILTSAYFFYKSKKI